MAIKKTLTGITMQLPLTERQEATLPRLEHEEAVLIALGMIVDPYHVFDMDSRRIQDVQRVARDIAEIRCAVLRTILIEEEQRKVRS